ncbi:CapA family protein [Actinoplanes sp. LDG1-06]|uniref:CapA family protein n=1 Tax=Paractinoplanes ovalisporus TaxID=2810368 RepID=A0ABS2ABH1_9ACTN|nr:CapA family protein [Actinoplanes ovalisporus]MBM2617170.1 CapA family protein [Actinoplanes ovalisporus]
MNSHPPHRRPGIFGRPVLTITIVLAALAGIGAGSVAFANRQSDDESASSWQEPRDAAAPSDSAAPTSAPTEKAAAEGTVTLSATGDIMMSNAPNRMPPANGEGFFDSVKEALASDLVMGNLEQPLTENTGASKCGSPPSPNCFAFRSPPSYVKHLKAGGFDLVNTANNHAKDFGTQGARNTRAVLDEAGIQATGNTDEITVSEVNGVKVAVVGFSSYAGANSLIDLDQARSVVEQAGQQADLVVVQVHMGAEGSDEQHVKPGTETFHGENRGDPIKFSHAVIDAGADLVVGHGPHVLRGMEFYNGKLIAYSLGNFAGGGRTLSRTGVLKYGGILQVTLGPDGSYAGGKLLSTYMNSNGLPTLDTQNEQGRKLVSQLSAADFPDTGAKISSDGSITPSA